MQSISLFEGKMLPTPIVKLSGNYSDNQIYVKRDDTIPFSFGGNKARKAAEFYKEIKNSGASVVMTYGTNSSNHCRIIANLATSMGLKCHIITPEENREILYNTKMVTDFGAIIETCPVTEVAKTIENRKEAYRKEGENPYFILGGGHGNPGTHSYVLCYEEILKQEKELGVHFDYIVHASGTGATQAGLVCGQLMGKSMEAMERSIIGISIAREESRGREVVKESILEYLTEKLGSVETYDDNKLIFTDKYRLGGYGNYSEEIVKTIETVMRREGMPMDTTYVGKAFQGMLQYLRDKEIQKKNILFIHTGGTPLFFDKL